MRLHVDKEADALYLRLDDSKIIESEEVSPGVVLDFDERNQVVGIEILNLSKRPRAHAQSGFARVPIPDRLTGKQKPLARELDALAYALCGLTPQEIKLVEGAAR